MISRHQLRLMIESVLLEGVKQDQRDLIEKYPQHAAELGKLQNKQIMWLAARFLGEQNLSDSELDKALKALKDYDSDAMGRKYQQAGWWRKKVDAAFPDKKWESPADMTNMSVDDMLKIIELSKMKKPRFEFDPNADVQGDKVGKVGPWSIWEASSRENSCRIIGKKPGTDEPRADICIAKTDASNLFYNYIADYSLFTIMHDEPEGVEDILVIGFKDDGTPEFNANRLRNPTVDGGNNSLRPERLQRILGEHYSEIMSVMRDRVLSRSGASPARQRISAAAKNMDDFRDITRGISQSEASALKQAIATRPGIIPEVEKSIIADPSWEARWLLAINPDISHDAMTDLAKDPERAVRSHLASNRVLHPDVLDFMARNENERTNRGAVARNPNTSEETLSYMLSKDQDEGVRMWAAENKKTPRESLMIAAKRDTPNVRKSIAQATADEKILRYLADDPDENVRQAVMANRSTPPELAQQIKSGGAMAGLRQLIRRMI